MKCPQLSKPEPTTARNQNRTMYTTPWASRIQIRIYSPHILPSMDLINWSLSAIDTIFSTRSLGSGEPVCPDGTFAAGYTRDNSFARANRVSGGSFRWGRWGYLPFRHHDNRYSADWIRLYPGLSKNSEDGNSCPKSHKAARFDWSCGKSGQQWDWDYKPEYGCHHDEIETWWFQRSEWTKRMSCGSLQLFAPKVTTIQSYLFWLPVPAPWPRPSG